MLVVEVEGVEAKALQEAATQLLAALGDPAAVVLGSAVGGKVNFVAAFSPQVGWVGDAAGSWGGDCGSVSGRHVCIMSNFDRAALPRGMPHAIRQT